MLFFIKTNLTQPLKKLKVKFNAEVEIAKLTSSRMIESVSISAKVLKVIVFLNLT